MILHIFISKFKKLTIYDCVSEMRACDITHFIFWMATFTDNYKGITGLTVFSSHVAKNIDSYLYSYIFKQFWCGFWIIKIFSASMVKRGKPAPDLFLYAAEKMGVPPKDCIVVEDSAKGIRAAVAAGMRAVGFIGGGHCLAGHGTGLLEEGADLVIDHIGELKTHL